MFEIPAEMDAWVLRPGRHGPPREALRLERVPVPTLGPGDVLVRVMAAGLNYSGVWAALGQPMSPFAWHGAPHHVPGTDGAGVVWAVGPGVTGVSVGDEVVIQPNVRCERCHHCQDPTSQRCERFRVHGYETPTGTFAQFTRARAYQLLPKPTHLTWEEAGSYLVCLMTAYHMLIGRAGLRRGDDVLVWGAAGGMGVYGVELCKLVGARAVGVVSSPERAALAMSLGCVGTLDRRDFPDINNVHRLRGRERAQGLEAIKAFREKIRGFLGGRDVDVVFEHPGEHTFFASVYVAGPEGRIVLSGATTGYDLTFDARYLWLARKSILGAHSAPFEEVKAAHQLVLDQKLGVVLTESFRFAQVAEANQRMYENNIQGNVACLIDAPDFGLRTTPTSWVR